MHVFRDAAWLGLLCLLGASITVTGSPALARSTSDASITTSSVSSSNPVIHSGFSSSRELLQAPRPAEPCKCSNDKKLVCGSDGTTYTNACKASCAGVDVDYEGECYDYEENNKPPAKPSPKPPTVAPKPTATVSRVAGCVCPAVYTPVCGSNGKTYSNSCEAQCAGIQVVAKAACEEADSVGTTVQPTAAGQDVKGCACPTALKPICTTTGITRGNECVAACKGEKIAYTGACRAGTVASAPAPALSQNPALRPPRKPGCVCTALYDPVCGVDGNTYSNRCEAGCYNMGVGSPGECGKVNVLSVPAQDSNACVVKCPTEGKQACGVNGQTYINTCITDCLGVRVAYPGACKPRCDACPTDWNPYCVSTSGWGPRTFANCCYAKCNSVKILSQVLHVGECKPQCNQKCDATLEKPLCCGGKTYKNGCFATCMGQDTEVCSPGRCSSVANVDQGTGCLLGPCSVKCNGYTYSEPVCGSDGKTYPDKCTLLCDQQVAIVAPGKCGVCAPNQPGGFPYCTPGDAFGFAPVCGTDGKTYRNKGAAWAAGTSIASGAPCDKSCGEAGEACFPNSSPAGSTCCAGTTCQVPSGITQEASKPAAGVCT
eukprot:GHUV01003170.1.p1 GENE.GHUV01003170.1~~GHUV01003170.1.p1  ORF type:complete len:601 (+),score=45.89 GHUV01003170.1:202-2004(+)